MWIEINIQAGDFEFMTRSDWDIDPEDDDPECRMVDVGIQADEQELHLKFVGVDDLRLFGQRITELAAWDFTHGRKVRMTREGDVIHDRQRRVDDDA